MIEVENDAVTQFNKLHNLLLDNGIFMMNLLSGDISRIEREQESNDPSYKIRVQNTDNFMNIYYKPRNKRIKFTLYYFNDHMLGVKDEIVERFLTKGKRDIETHERFSYRTKTIEEMAQFVLYCLEPLLNL